MVSKKVIVRNKSGLHMRPASVFVKLCSSFESDIKFSIRDKNYNGKSLMSTLGAVVKKDDEIEIFTDGKDEKEAMDAIVKEIENGLGE
ncbi:MAG: HPr family phosphocarrier protein [Defluviitaleaceae bacterium]|nr:HPr family phosphocarrier protein [Defluviitaleaceae bacterium]